MSENKNRNIPETLDSDEMGQVVGGACSDTGWLDDHIPGHWAVTCANCGMQFFVRRNRDCPSCANKEVLLTYDSSKPIFDSEKRAWT